MPSQFESPVATEKSGSDKPLDPPKVIVPPLVGAANDESFIRAVDAERSRSQQMAIDDKRAMDEVLAENKILQAKIQSFEKEVVAAKNLSAAITPTPTIPAIPTFPPTPPFTESDFLSSMPTKADGWKLFKTPKPIKDKFGSFKGTAQLTVGAKIDRIVWFPQRTTDTKARQFFELSQSDYKISLHSNGRSEQVAYVDIDGTKATFSWVTSAATIQSNPTLAKDLQEELSRTALIVCMNRVFEWYIFDAIPKIRLDPNSERKIFCTHTTTGFHYSVDGKQWVAFKDGVVDIDIPSDNGFIGKLKCKSAGTGNFLSVMFRFPAEFNEETLENAGEAIKTAEENLDSAEKEFKKFDEVLARAWETEMMKLRKDAKDVLENAQGVLVVAKEKEEDIKDSQSKFLVDIEKTRVLVGPVNGVPIAEIQMKNTRFQQKSE